MSYQRAIHELYSNVHTCVGDEPNVVAYDVNGNVVPYDASAVATKKTEFDNADNLYWLRVERDAKLAETDYLALSDQTLTSAMTTYRQALRDITDSATSLEDVTWPTKP
jgi:hypothetical protein